MAEAVRVRKEILDWLRAEAVRAVAQECCGLLAGAGDVISAVFPARNALESATAFEIAPDELFSIFRSIHAAGLEHLGIYHSHPAGPATPSPTDIERAYYPDAAYFILSPLSRAEVAIRAFSIRDGRCEDLTIERV